jgi:hypothetical protein
MQARHAVSEDFASGGFDLLIESNHGHDVEIHKDKIAVVGPVGKPSGCLVWRPCALIHELLCGKGLNQRAVADELILFSARFARSSVFRPQEALFMIRPENFEMQNYAEFVGAREEQGRLYAFKL